MAWRQAALGLVLILASTLAGWRLVEFASLPEARAGIDDFRAFYQGAHDLVKGESPYYTGFVSPPWFALLVAPLTFLPYDTAATLWFCFSLACLAGLALAAFRLVNWGPGPLALLCAALVVAVWPPMLLGLRLGQNSNLVALAALGALLLYRAGHRAPAGILLTVAAVKPHLSFLLIAGLALHEFRYHRTWRLPLALTLGVGEGLLLATIVAPAWLPHVLTDRPESWNYWGSVVTLNTLFAWALGEQRLLGVLLYLPLLLVGAAAVLLMWWYEGDLVEKAAVTLAATLVLTPYAYPHDYVLLVLPLVVCARWLVAQPRLGLALGLPAGLAVWHVPRLEDYTPLRFLSLLVPLLVLGTLLVARRLALSGPARPGPRRLPVRPLRPQAIPVKARSASVDLQVQRLHEGTLDRQRVAGPQYPDAL